MSVNKVILVGNLGADPEMKMLPSGSAVTNFSIATSEKFTNKQNGEKEERTDWHRITVYGKQAEIASKYLAKGRQVFIEGRISYRKAEAKDGSGVKYFTDIIANRIQFLGGRNDAEKANGLDADESDRAVPRNFNPMESDEEVPF